MSKVLKENHFIHFHLLLQNINTLAGPVRSHALHISLFHHLRKPVLPHTSLALAPRNHRAVLFLFSMYQAKLVCLICNLVRYKRKEALVTDSSQGKHGF